MSAGLTSHGTVLKSLSEIWKEVCGYNRDILGLAGSLNRRDCALQRLSAATCRNQCIQLRIRAHQCVGCLCAALGSGSCILRFGKGCLIIRMILVPLVNTGLVAFPSAEPCRITLLPADQTDVSAALVKQDVDQLLAVLRLVLMNSADIVIGSLSQIIDILAVLLADDAEELSQINLVRVAGRDCGLHLGICGVADDDALAACCAQLLDGSRNLLGYMSLVDILDIDAKRLCGLIQNLLTLRTKHVRGAPDGDTDRDVLVVDGICLSNGCPCHHRSDHSGAEHSADKSAFHDDSSFKWILPAFPCWIRKPDLSLFPSAGHLSLKHCVPEPRCLSCTHTSCQPSTQDCL